MKKILFLLCILPLFVLSQSESQQKQTYRSGPSGGGSYSPKSSYPRSSYSPRSYTQPSRVTQPASEYSESGSKYNYRNQRNYRQSAPNSSGYNPGPRWNRRLPYSIYPYYDDWYFHSPWANRYSFWRPYYWYDPYGYRQFGRVYYYDDDLKIQPDTVRIQRPNVSVGVQYSTNEIGAFLVLGNKVYFIAEYQKSFQRDKSVYYEDITTDKVIPWRDKKLGDIKRFGTFYLGLGKRIGRLGVHGQLGFCQEEYRYQYFDELYILSNNGNYSFPNYKDNFVSAKFGALYDFNLVTAKADYDPIKKSYTLGLGVNF